MVTPVISGGYVLGGGAICMELLTKQARRTALFNLNTFMYVDTILLKYPLRINCS